ncbi:MAG: hypothetical protein ACFB21_10010, partial [Opitutales bacterium]
MNPSTKLPCKNCGAELAFSPAEQSLQCPYCGTTNAIETGWEVSYAHEEKDFETAIAEARAATATELHTLSECEGCGAEVDLPANVASEACPFCGGTITRGKKQEELFEPQAVLPFALESSEAGKRFRRWVKSRWFAPGELKRMANSHDGLKGVYLPHWTFDADTVTRYRGERGDDYTEWYEDEDADGNKVRKSRTKTRWSRVAGWVHNRF